MISYFDMSIQKKIMGSDPEISLPRIESFPNGYENYLITIVVPEYTALCPKTSQPDFGKIIIEYIPDKFIIELKSLKLYIHAYRDIGIFYENAVNRILDDIARDIKPKWAKVRGEFRPRGGINSYVEARYPRKTAFSGCDRKE